MLPCLQINEDGIFIGPDGAPLDREGMPIPGATINPTTGFITVGGMQLGPDGVPLPEEISYPANMTIAADGVPRTLDGESPTPCGRPGAGCVGTPGTSISEFGILTDVDGLPLTRDGSAVIPGATGIDDEGFIIDAIGGNGTRLGPTGEPIPDDDSLKANVTVTPDGVPRDIGTMEPEITSRGGFANGDGLYFDSDGAPLNRDTGEPLPSGTTLGPEGYLMTANGTNIGPDGLPMPEDIVLPVDHVVTPERRPRDAATSVGIGPQGTKFASA